MPEAFRYLGWKIETYDEPSGLRTEQWVDCGTLFSLGPVDAVWQALEAAAAVTRFSHRDAQAYPPVVDRATVRAAYGEPIQWAVRPGDEVVIEDTPYQVLEAVPAGVPISILPGQGVVASGSPYTHTFTPSENDERLDRERSAAVSARFQEAADSPVTREYLSELDFRIVPGHGITFPPGVNVQVEGCISVAPGGPETYTVDTSPDAMIASEASDVLDHIDQVLADLGVE